MANNFGGFRGWVSLAEPSSKAREANISQVWLKISNQKTKNTSENYSEINLFEL